MGAGRWNARLVTPVAGALLLGLMTGGAIGHETGQALSGTSAPTSQASESLSGTVREVSVVNQVVNKTSRYLSLQVDGKDVVLTGPSVETLAKGATVEVTGHLAGNLMSVTQAKTLALPPSRAQAQALVQVSGTLTMFHADDFANGTGTFGFVVRSADGNATQLKLAVPPDALQSGMQVVVAGSIADDGFSLEANNIVILALPVAKPMLSDHAVAQATTNKTLLVMIKFTDSPSADASTPAQVDQVMRTNPDSVTNYYQEVSYGQHLLNVTVAHIPPSPPPSSCDSTTHPSGCWLKATVATPAGCDFTAVGTAADAAANAAGYAVSSYDNVYYLMPYNGSCGWAGLAYIGYGRAWSNGYNQTSVYAHELGHNFGLYHAGTLSCAGEVIGGSSCSVVEYADPYVVMGNNSTGHFNTHQLASYTKGGTLGWIADTTVSVHISGTTTYSLTPIETAGGATYAVRIPAATTRIYWVEFRQPIGFDAGVPNNGAQIRVSSPFEFPCPCPGGGDETWLLDTNPGTASFSDSTLSVGQTFADLATGTTINVLAKDTAHTPAQWLQVKVSKVNLPMLGDFDNDAYSDLLWQSPSTSQGAFWFMKTGAVSNTAYFGLPAGWSPQGVGDINGDGKADIVWTNPGQNLAAIWFMNGSTVSSSAYYAVPNSWSVAAIGDFNGDGKADILWRNINGQITAWLMNGSTIQSVVNYSNVDSSWVVLGTGDFFGDGKSEVVWNHQPDGTVYLWRDVDQSSPQLVSLGAPGGTWQVAAIGDFAGDGKADLFLRDATGANAIWKAGSSSSAVFPPGVPTSWSVMTAKQLYGDGRSDVIWRRSDGLVAHWRFDSSLAPIATFLTIVPMNWSKVGN